MPLPLLPLAIIGAVKLAGYVLDEMEKERRKSLSLKEQVRLERIDEERRIAKAKYKFYHKR
jgi:hypothetical protein